MTRGTDDRVRLSSEVNTNDLVVLYGLISLARRQAELVNASPEQIDVFHRLATVIEVSLRTASRIDILAALQFVR